VSVLETIIIAELKETPTVVVVGFRFRQDLTVLMTKAASKHRPTKISHSMKRSQLAKGYLPRLAGVDPTTDDRPFYGYSHASLSLHGNFAAVT
jgi:hypothetical protein